MLIDQLQAAVLAVTTVYQIVASVKENRQPMPGQVWQQRHFYTQGQGNPTIVLDHSLGGVEGYALVETLSELSQVFVYDRAGYGWSAQRSQPRTSLPIAQELDALLQAANIPPPYLLVGDSFGSFNTRLYAHLFPEKVVGLVLTDGLHESGMLHLPIALKLLKLFFLSGFVMSTLGSATGIVRIIERLGLFEVLKPELRYVPQPYRQWMKRSFCRPKHWITMARELGGISQSAKEASIAQQLGALPIVSIKARSFFKPSLWTRFIPLRQANRVRDTMHQSLSQLSDNVQVMAAPDSGHFVWIDQPEVIVEAVKSVLRQVGP